MEHARYGRRTFGTTPEFAAETAPMMANQGLYNAFLAAGLDARPFARRRQRRRSSCSAAWSLAGVVGAATVKRAILWLQALPAALAIGATLLAR